MSLITILELVPLIGSGLLFALPKGNAKLIKQSAFALSVVTLIVSLLIAYRFKTNVSGMQFVESRSWIANFGIRYAVGIDGMALVLILLTSNGFTITIIRRNNMICFSICKCYFTCL